jgi:hypothetical protein
MLGLQLKNFHFSIKVPEKPPAPAPEPMPVPPAPEPVAVLAGPNDEREVLIKLATERGIKIDKRWKTDRIRAILEHS